MKLFLPDMYQKNILEINYEKLKKKKIKVLLFDFRFSKIGILIKSA